MTSITKLGLAALLAGSSLAGAAFAQETPKVDGTAPTAAAPVAPGQTKTDGQAAADKAPGQQQKAGEAGSAAEAAPGQVKTNGKADGEMKPATPADKAANEAAPGQMQKTGEADAAKDAAPGQMQKTGDADTAKDAAPGQAKTGQAATDAKPSGEAASSIDISTEQKTEIRSVIQETRVAPAKIDIDLTVGVAVPATVEFHALPPRIVEIVPQYRGYQYFLLADGRIIIVEPASHHVVYILVV